jgi:hypothetical protein
MTEEIDHRFVHVGGALLLGPVTAARQHDRLAKLRHEFRQVGKQLIHPWKGYDKIAGEAFPTSPFAGN